VEGGKVVSWEAGRWSGWVFHLNIRKLLNANLPNENNYQIITNPSTAVDNFSLKVFTEENTTALAERRVKVDKRGKAGEVEEVGGIGG
jgi:hypothetical protein